MADWQNVPFFSVKTVETHKARLTAKLGMKSRVELLRYAREKGLLRVE